MKTSHLLKPKLVFAKGSDGLPTNQENGPCQRQALKSGSSGITTASAKRRELRPQRHHPDSAYQSMNKFRKWVKLLFLGSS